MKGLFRGSFFVLASISFVHSLSSSSVATDCEDGSRISAERMVDKGLIDLVLVPSGLAIMFGYHLFLLYRILRFPHTTVVGYENHNMRAWVERMLKASPGETSVALNVISNNMSESSSLASVSISLSSLIGTWIGSTSKLFMTGRSTGTRASPPPPSSTYPSSSASSPPSPASSTRPGTSSTPCTS
ncbi:uncharacterized protein M6B38_383145 [Iris pallida]|uniref:Uncharacterized protein n=1 Tax=Iris pallida TaxID=29817 RepID=A0AAX6G4F8_IRIPA|nr:uncharacterized protein M6B38_383145 [Iris pallida]